jgi:hypothetical protein
MRLHQCCPVLHYLHRSLEPTRKGSRIGHCLVVRFVRRRPDGHCPLRRSAAVRSPKHTNPVGFLASSSLALAWKHDLLEK